MAYKIELTKQNVGNLLMRFAAFIEKDGRFKAGLEIDLSSRAWKPHGTTILVQRVRLTKAKPYCGQHPGPCPVDGKKKPNSTYLEWDDWVAFHNLVNDFLDAEKLTADVHSTPFDVKGKMWIRKGDRRRIHYDWDEQMINGRLIRVWNQGTDDQFTCECDFCNTEKRRRHEQGSNA